MRSRKGCLRIRVRVSTSGRTGLANASVERCRERQPPLMAVSWPAALAPATRNTATSSQRRVQTTLEDERGEGELTVNLHALERLQFSVLIVLPQGRSSRLTRTVAPLRRGVVVVRVGLEILVRSDVVSCACGRRELASCCGERGGERRREQWGSWEVGGGGGSVEES